MNKDEFYSDRSHFFLLTKAELPALIESLDGWECLEETFLKKRYDFKTYQEGVLFVNRAAKRAEDVNHHPDLLLGYKYVVATIWTHNVNGLSKADFALAQDIDQLFSR